jgi:hypothetical protein
MYRGYVVSWCLEANPARRHEVVHTGPTAFISDHYSASHRGHQWESWHSRQGVGSEQLRVADT